MEQQKQGMQVGKWIAPVLVVLWGGVFFAVLGWKPTFAYNAQRYFEWLLLGVLLILGLAQPVKWTPSKKQIGLITGLAAAASGVALLSHYDWLAWRYLLSYTLLIMAALSVAKVRQAAGKVTFDRAALLGVFILCLGCSLIVLQGLLLSLSIGQVNLRIVYDAFVNVRFLSHLQFATLFFFPAAALLAATKKWRWAWALLGVIWWMWLWFSGTRAALIVVPWAILVVAICVGKKGFPWLRHLVMQLVGGVVLFGGLRWLLSDGASSPALSKAMTMARSGASGRFTLWQEGWTYFLQHPWLGSGPGVFACLTPRPEAKPHNIALLLLSEWGVVVTLFVAAIALWAFVTMVKRLRQSPNPIALSLFASVVALVTAMQGQGTLVSPLGQMAGILVFGWAWSEFAPQQFKQETIVNGPSGATGFTLKTAKWRWFTGLLLALALGGWLVMAKADLALQKDLLVSDNGIIRLSYGPRYWADGHDHCPLWHQSHYKAPPDF